MSTAVWIVMCNEPVMGPPTSGLLAAYFSRMAMSPGISFSAIAISLRPQSARLMSIREKYAASKPLVGVRITGSLHMTIQTAVLIQTLNDLGASVRWASCNIFSTQDHAAAAVAKSGVSVFAWKGESLEDYWSSTYHAISHPNGKGPQLVVDDGGDATLLIHKG